jgi:peptidoglycan/LPS O-acetylase OafA/YrhL
MARRTLRWFGLVSYGIFLWHVGVLWALRDLGVTKALTPDGLIPLFLIVFPISVGLAAISYHWVERPFYALKDRRVRRRGAPGKRRPARARA